MRVKIKATVEIEDDDILRAIEGGTYSDAEGVLDDIEGAEFEIEISGLQLSITIEGAQRDTR